MQENAEDATIGRGLLDHYGTARFHGLFLFLSSGDSPAFIEAHWRDLHHLTGDYLDIYYGRNDIAERTSGYEIAAGLRAVSLRVEVPPALLLWEDALAAAEAIELHDLDHGQVVVVAQAVVQAIGDGCALHEVLAAFASP